MNLKELLEDDSAVSPVIGVILMVAITVILAAVIATFVLGLGEQVSDTSPNASFTFDYNEGNTSVNVTHAGGENIPDSALSISGDQSASGNWGVSGDVSAGDTATVGVSAGETISVVYDNPDADESSVLQRFEVPE